MRPRLVRKTITITSPVRKRATLGQKPNLIPVIPAYDPNDGVGALAIIAKYNSKVRNPMTGIRAKCVECSGGSLKEVNECHITTCALHPFRMGVNPFNKKTRARLQGELDEADAGEDSDDE